MNKPSSTIQAAGIGGILAGVPIGTYLGSITMGIINAAWPDVFEALAVVGDIQAAISGVFSVVIAVAIGYFKKENVLRRDVSVPQIPE